MKRIAVGVGLAAVTAAVLVWALSPRENEAKPAPSRPTTAFPNREAPSESPHAATAGPQAATESPSSANGLRDRGVTPAVNPSHARSRRPPVDDDLPAPAGGVPGDQHLAVEQTFDDLALAEIGMEEDEIDRIYERWEEWRDAKAGLPPLTLDADDALDALAERSSLESSLEEELRADLGDEGYDAMRFATNKPNRIILSPSNPNSPTWQAGILDGDELIRYDGERVFSPEQLKELLKAGPPGEMVPTEVLHGDQIFRTEIPRGPLGSPVFWGHRPPFSE